MKIKLKWIKIKKYECYNRNTALHLMLYFLNNMRWFAKSFIVIFQSTSSLESNLEGLASVLEADLANYKTKIIRILCEW